MSLYDPWSFSLKQYNSLALEADESWLILGLRCFPGGSLEPLVGSREPLAVGDQTTLVDIATGQAIVNHPLGEDAAWKAILLSFTEPIMLEFMATILGSPAFYRASYQPIPMLPGPQHYQLILPTRSMMDAWQTVATRSFWRITNEGNQPASGTLLLMGKRKRGQITWL